MKSSRLFSLLSLTFLLLYACSCRSLILPSILKQYTFPVLSHPDYTFQFEMIDDEPFPFSPGQIIEVPVLMVLHTLPNPEILRLHATTTWYASLYPDGAPTSQETIMLNLREVGSGTTYELHGYLDEDDILLVLSDKEIPRILYPDPKPGDVSQVCIALVVDSVVTFSTETPAHSQVTLRPTGQDSHGLLKTDIHDCPDH